MEPDTLSLVDSRIWRTLKKVQDQYLREETVSEFVESLEKTNDYFSYQDYTKKEDKSARNNNLEEVLSLYQKDSKHYGSNYDSLHKKELKSINYNNYQSQNDLTDYLIDDLKEDKWSKELKDFGLKQDWPKNLKDLEHKKDLRRDWSDNFQDLGHKKETYPSAFFLSDKVKGRLADLKKLLYSLNEDTLDELLPAIDTVIDGDPRRVDGLVDFVTKLDSELVGDASQAALSVIKSRNASPLNFSYGSFRGHRVMDTFYDTALSLGEELEPTEFRWWAQKVVALGESGQSYEISQLAKDSTNLVKAYETMGLSFDNLMQDFETYGPSVLKAGKFLDTFRAIPQCSEIYRELIKKERLTSVMSAVDEHSISVLAEKYRNATADDYLTAINGLMEIHNTLIDHDMNGPIVAHRLQGMKRARNLVQLQRSLQEEKSSIEDYIGFALKQKNKDPHEFSSKNLQDALILYEGRLGKSYRAFKQDVERIGLRVQKLPDIERNLRSVFESTKVRSLLNQVIKLRNRDLIELMDRSYDRNYLSDLASRLKEHNAKDCIKVLGEFCRTYSFLKNTGHKEDIRNAFDDDTCEPSVLIDRFREVREAYYPQVIGSDLEIPDSLKNSMDNLIVAYFKNTGSIDIQPALRAIARSTIRNGPDKTFDILNNFKGNRELIRGMREDDIDIDTYQHGISKTYHISTDGNAIQRVQEQLNGEIDTIYQRLALVVDEEVISTFKELDDDMQLDMIDKFVGNNEFPVDDLREEIQGHIQKARSLKGRLPYIENQEFSADVEFYVSTDPMEALHCGQYFGSCLSLSKECGATNSWAAVVQTMNANMNVIYAKSDGNYIGRNRTVLTDEGILCTKFYHKGSLPLVDSWFDYLTEYARACEQDVLLPDTFVKESMKDRLEEMVRDGSARRADINVSFDTPVLEDFYKDGLNIEREDGRYVASFSGYVLEGKQ